MRTSDLASVARAARLPLAALLLGLLPAGCSSSSEAPAMTREERLGYYLENAARYYDLRDLDRAIGQVERGLELDPDNERLLLMKARCHLQRDTRDDILLAESILRKHPNRKDYRVCNTLGAALERKGLLYDIAANEIASGDRYTEAADPQAEAQRLHTKALDAWTEAVAQYRASNDAFSGGIEALNGQMRCESYLGRDDDAFATSEVLLAAIRDSNSALKARQREMENSENDTWPVQRQILGNEELAGAVHLHRSELLKKKGLTLDALAELDAILELDPEWAEIYSRRGLLFLELGDPERARAALNHFVVHTELPYEHPDIQRAYELIAQCDAELAARDTADALGGG